jgi:hypothetical protein
MSAQKAARRGFKWVVGGGSVYCTLHCVEENLPFSSLERRLENKNDIAFWWCTHSDVAPLPVDRDALAVQNQATALRMAVSALSVSRTRPGDPRAQFNISVAASNLEGAGRGAHIAGRACQGQVLTFFNGPLYAPFTGRITLFLRSLFGMWPDEPHRRGTECIIAREDGYVVLGLDTGSSDAARGPLLNHPNNGDVPNAMIFPAVIDTSELDTGDLAELKKISWYACHPWTFDPSRFVRVILVVALRDVANEELFFDYNFNPEGSLPEWYTRAGAWGHRPSTAL